MTDLNTLIDKDALEQLKNIDPKLALAELTSKLSSVTHKQDNDEEDSDDDNDEIPSHEKMQKDAQKEAEENRKKLRAKINNMKNARKGREYALKKDINMIKETSMLNNVGKDMDISSIMMQMVGGMGQSSKQRKKMKKMVDKMVDKMET